ncbi:MAG: acyltransferase [Dokdonella sp.]
MAPLDVRRENSPIPPLIDGRRLRHIDALRALAALLVVWRHVADFFVQADPSGNAGGHWMQVVADKADVGHIGVIVFFLISGYVIPFSIHAGRRAAVGSFLIKRFFRIFPAYWLSIPLGALTGFWIWKQPFSAQDFLINLTLLQSLFGARAAEGLYWTLLAEWAFYALCVALLLSGSLANMRRVCLLSVALLSAYVLQLAAKRVGMPVANANIGIACFYLSVMLCGTLYRTCVVEESSDDAKLFLASVYGLFAAHLVILPAAGWWLAGFGNSPWISSGVGFAVFIIGTRWLRVSTRLTDWLGQISYSIYLFHPVVFMALWWLLLRQPIGSWWRSQHLGVYLLVNAGLTIAMAALVYRFVEKPGIRIGHHCAEFWTRRAQDPSSTTLMRETATASINPAHDRCGPSA